MVEGKLYFAHGSDIDLDQMAQRCLDAQMVGPVILENYGLLFHGNLQGTGMATIAPREGSTVYGLLWDITPECERFLDYYKGYPHLYGEESVAIHGHDRQEHMAIAYVITELCKEPSIPSFYYYNDILEGYRQSRLPTTPLKQAWEHCAEEVRQETERINRSACGQLLSRQKRDHGRQTSNQSGGRTYVKQKHPPIWGSTCQHRTGLYHRRRTGGAENHWFGL